MKRVDGIRKMILLSLVILFLRLMVLAQEKVEAPVWNVGDKWSYKDATGRTWTTEVVEIKEDLYIIKQSGVQDFYAYDKKTLNLK